ncbi:MAG: DNRLRE domain-containing protein [Deltaproteobacteria bacterium]|nr:DNRLRE domain-containing protein [Deltaproteobacteria bacterium]
MQIRKVSPLKRALLYTVVLSLSFIFAWQVTGHAATTVTFGDNTGDDGDDFPGTIEDALIWEGGVFLNYGGTGTIPVGEGANLGEASRSLIRFKNIASHLPDGAVITSATMYLFCSSEDSTTDHSVSAYGVLQDWGEGNLSGGFGFDICSWNYFQYYNFLWKAAGCDVASDGTGEDSTADRRATAEAGTLITGTGGWFTWDLTAAVQNWYSYQWSEYGVQKGLRLPRGH